MSSSQQTGFSAQGGSLLSRLLQLSSDLFQREEVLVYFSTDCLVHLSKLCLHIENSDPDSWEEYLERWTIGLETFKETLVENAMAAGETNQDQTAVFISLDNLIKVMKLCPDGPHFPTLQTSWDPPGFPGNAGEYWERMMKEGRTR